ncbi:Uncharacterised protein [Salmonella enterica subsp. enterica serovar Bovismorbificans]|uniref:Uncharacterized protein n=1 Tax=Salmonella enterica subsp. enterica serovar Bovismorbificans TaxID=58097 RepID=A0A655C1I0_SALET|nr:Uncharacterised protein [Salmonella enterica subsp. enterica serovar Bovismorbificans]
MKILTQSGARQLTCLAFKRIAGLCRGGAHKERKLHVFPVGFDMRVFIQIAHQCPGAGPVSQSTVGAMRAEILAAEAI